MKQSFTLVKKHGSDQWEVALGPTAQNREHRNFFRTRRRARADAQYSEVVFAEQINSVKLDRLVASKVVPDIDKYPVKSIPNQFAPIQPPPAPAPVPGRPKGKPASKKMESIFGARIAAK